MNERDLMAICLDKIEQTINWKTREEWTDSDYKVLSQRISDQTEINISTHTLKRLYGKIKYKDTYNPQYATKDALARFIGYADWHNFTETQNKKKKKTRWKPMGFAALGLSLIGLALLFFLQKKNTEVNLPELSISVDKTIGEVPLTVSFNYDLKRVKRDSVFIDFGYVHHFQGYQKFALSSDLKNINHCFQAPGFYHINILYKDKILQTLQIQALSNEWIGKITDGETRSMERIKNESTTNEDIIKYGQNNIILDRQEDGWLYLSPQAINAAGFANNQVYYLHFENYFSTNLSADNFSYEAKFKNSKKYGGITCFDSKMEIIAENGPILISFAEEGCHRWTELSFSDYKLNGQHDNLDFLSCDLEEWNVLKIVNIDKKVTIYLNNKPIHELIYSSRLGNIKGLQFHFKGSGMVDWVKLKDESGQIVFDDEF